jgi:hypothetical protein
VNAPSADENPFGLSIDRIEAVSRFQIDPDLKTENLDAQINYNE